MNRTLYFSKGMVWREFIFECGCGNIDTIKMLASLINTVFGDEEEL